MDNQPRRATWPSVVALLALVVLVGTLVLAGWLALQDDSPLVNIGFPAPPGVLRVGLAEPITTLDPAQATTVSDHTLHALLYEGLLATGDTLSVEPRLAESLPGSSPDGLSWTVTCRSDVIFHDGTPFTCHDVASRLEQLDSERASLANNYVDASTLLALLDRIDSLETPGEHTLTVHLNAPFTFFHEGLAHPAAAIARDGLGTGPFLLENWEPQTALLAAHNDYWAGPPELESLFLGVMLDPSERTAALGNRFDVIADPPYDAALDEDTQLLTAPGALLIYGLLNRSVNPLQEPQFRAALHLGIDPQALADQVYAGDAQPAPLLASPALPGYEHLPASVFESDVRHARELQANAGSPDGYDAALVVDAYLPRADALAIAARTQLDALYIEGTTEMLESSVEREIEDGAPLILTGHRPLDAYAALIWLADAPPPAGRNVLEYDNNAFETWLQQAIAAPTPEARDAALEGAREALLADPPVVSLVAPDVRVAAAQEVSGLSVSPLGWLRVTHKTLVLRR